jgi:hypothetical protein
MLRVPPPQGEVPLADCRLISCAARLNVRDAFIERCQLVSKCVKTCATMGTQEILDLAAGLFARDLNVILMHRFYQIVGHRTSMT